MTRRVAYLTASAGLMAFLGGCALSFFDFETREPWRAEAEKACFAQHLVSPSPYLQQIRAITQNRVCGLEMPLQVAGLDRGTVMVSPTAILGCPETAALESWLRGSVQPAAMARFGAPVVSIRQLSSYACRSRNNVRGAKVSEHAFGNALDVAAFTFANGQTVTVRSGWNGSQAERDFLREVHAGACQYFTTVLGPGVPQHGDHFHLDLRRHNGQLGTHYCKPTPVRPAPPRAIDQMPVAAIPDAGAPPTGFTVVEPSDDEVNRLVFEGNPFGVNGGSLPEGGDAEPLDLMDP